ncbi:MAG: hypothetical protein COZ56_07710 [Armatimonadetes bacterium CG_4_8_14_3_um_filter_58_9]|nr:MAG: hypothetical protein COZ56_07710 [Armatimonadetes bacterium CG_4_8_14_3_um_filter_58_9]
MSAVRILSRLLIIGVTIGVLLAVRSLRAPDLNDSGRAHKPEPAGDLYGAVPIGGTLIGGKLHYVELDLEQWDLRVLRAESIGAQVADAETYARKTGARIVINGGFFDEQLKPLGLVVTDNKVNNPIHPANWGVFLVCDSGPRIVHQRDYRAGPERYALQSGPRLVVKGEVTSLKPGKAFRSAVGITSHDRVVLAATENTALSLAEFAEILARPQSQGGLGCVDALNLDGGPSTQFFINLDNVRVSVPGGWGIPTALAAFPRGNKGR